MSLSVPFNNECTMLCLNKILNDQPAEVGNQLVYNTIKDECQESCKDVNNITDKGSLYGPTLTFNNVMYSVVMFLNKLVRHGAAHSF